MTTKTYAELLKDPRWQQRRLEVFERSGFECEHCGATDKTLNIHHAYYEKDKKPWDYPLESLVCYCEDCHKAATQWQAILKQEIKRLDIATLPQAIGYLRVMNTEWHCLDEDVHLENYEYAQGVADYYRLDVDEILKSLYPRHNINTRKLHKMSLAARRRKNNGKSTS